MPIDIRAPDGTTARFPDGTDDETITRVMRENFGGPENPLTSQTPAPSSVPDFARIRSAANEAMMNPDPASVVKSTVHDERRPIGGSLGVVPLAEDKDGQLHPSVPGMVLEPMRAFKRGLEREAVRGHYGEDGKPLYDPRAQSHDAVAASGLMATGAAVPKVVAPAVVPSARQAALSATQRQGIDVPRAAASDNLATKAVAGALKEIPIVGSPIATASKKAAGDIEGRVSNIADDLGSGSRLNAGETMRDDIANWVKVVSRDEAEEIYAPVEALIPTDARNPLRVTGRIVSEIVADAEASKLKPPPIVATLKAAVSDKAGLTYKGLQNLRTQIGDMMSGNIAPEPGMSKRSLEAVYAGLSEDMAWLLKKSGGDKAVGAWRSANEAFAKQIATRRDALLKVIGPDGNNSPEGIVDKLVTMAGAKKGADVTRLLMAKQTVGKEAWSELASSVVASMGRDKDGFSIAKFRTAYENLSGNGKDALFGREHRQALDDLALIGGKFEGLQRLGNPSGTGRVASLLLGGSSLYADPLTAMASAAGGLALAHILSRPATAKSAASWARSHFNALTKPSNATHVVADQMWRRLLVEAGVDPEAGGDAPHRSQGGG